MRFMLCCQTSVLFHCRGKEQGWMTGEGLFLAAPPPHITLH